MLATKLIFFRFLLRLGKPRFLGQRFDEERITRKYPWNRENMEPGAFVKKVSLPFRCFLIREHWRPKVVASRNGREVRLVEVCRTYLDSGDHRNTQEISNAWSLSNRNSSNLPTIAEANLSVEYS
jgi:hypothetical protein